MIHLHWNHYLLSALILVTLPGQARETGSGQQYQCPPSDQLEKINKPCAISRPSNIHDYMTQIHHIHQMSPDLYQQHYHTFSAIQNWLHTGADVRQLSQSGLRAQQMKGAGHFGNVQFTGYYTPVIQARHTAQSEFRYPLYRMPQIKYPLPVRAAIYSGALNQSDAVAWSRSLLDNFIMEVQGSGYIDFGNGTPPTFMAYAGRNQYPYRSIAKVLIDRGEITRENMSLQAIRKWAHNHNEGQVRELLEQNPSFIFFKPAGYGPVTGASKVALIAGASVAADPLLIPAGTVLLAEIPLLDKDGKFTGRHQIHLMTALDVGSAIKGQHLDIYQGVGHDAERNAGYLNHYGRVWILQAK